MIQTCTIINKNNDQKVKKCKDMQKYIKPLYCSCCDTMIHSHTLDLHNKTDFHKTSQHIRNMSIEPIEDIKKKVLEYKMIQKYIKKHLITIHHQILNIMMKLKTKKLMKKHSKESNVKVKAIKEN